MTSRKIERAREALLTELSRLRLVLEEIFNMNFSSNCSLLLLLGGRSKASSLNIPVGDGERVSGLESGWL